MSSIWTHVGAIWTHVGSACMADESSAGKYVASSGRFMHKGSNTGPIYGRCNVTNPRDSGRNPSWNCLEVVYRCAAETDQVTAELVRVSNETGGVYTLATFDSNDFETSPDEQTSSVDFLHNFDFEDYAYYVQIKVSRTSSAAGHNPSVSIVRLKEVPEHIDWEIRLDRLRVSQTNESSDEPYFVMLGFRSTFDTPGSTSVFWRGELNDDDEEWAADSVAGDEHDIPRRQGVVTFPNVHYIPSPWAPGTNLEVIGALAIALESDTTPWGIMINIVEHVRTALETEVRRLIEEQPVSLDFDVEDIEAAVRNVKDSIDFPLWLELALASVSTYDVDDVIGYHLFGFVPIDPELAEDEVEEGYHLGALLERQFTLPDNAIRFAGEDAVYLVNAAVAALLPE